MIFKMLTLKTTVSFFITKMNAIWHFWMVTMLLIAFCSLLDFSLQVNSLFYITNSSDNSVSSGSNKEPHVSPVALRPLLTNIHIVLTVSNYRIHISIFFALHILFQCCSQVPLL